MTYCRVTLISLSLQTSYYCCKYMGVDALTIKLAFPMTVYNHAHVNSGKILNIHVIIITNKIQWWIIRYMA